MCIVRKGFPKVSSTKRWVSQGFRGFPAQLSVFEPESKERVVFLRGFPWVFQRFPWVSEVSSTFRKVAD